ncbi:unnamed protein product [Porites evermanni]|uniref:DDE Tnp4 domain-containing protein n=1 Tax=Porites evermanni TaxID=104178 RepID=A0ABN8LE74_9CNID|nr:unnamed protein product [Porites evermanni]
MSSLKETPDVALLSHSQVCPISEPKENQSTIYNGHKRVHAIKFQSVTTSNGLIANLYGPVEGKRHDAAILRDSGLLANLENYAISPAGQPMCLYGDPAYPLRIHLQALFRDVRLAPEMESFNQSMSHVRVSVEWIFGDVVK